MILVTPGQPFSAVITVAHSSSASITLQANVPVRLSRMRGLCKQLRCRGHVRSLNTSLRDRSYYKASAWA